MMKIMFLKRVFFKSDTHVSYTTLREFYGRNKDFLCSFPSGWDLFAEVQLQKHLWLLPQVWPQSNYIMNGIVIKIICFCSLKCFCIVLPTNFSSRAAQKLVIYIKVRLHSHCHPHSHHHSHHHHQHVEKSCHPPATTMVINHISQRIMSQREITFLSNGKFWYNSESCSVILLLRKEICNFHQGQIFVTVQIFQFVITLKIEDSWFFLLLV